MSVQEVSHAPAAFKPKKSVALSGTPAGETAVCTVGQSGNDLHYRGYDIADLAEHCEFAEVATRRACSACEACLRK
jgi:2-methylcitrate synthase